jgi:hypothetical protein
MVNFEFTASGTARCFAQTVLKQILAEHGMVGGTLSIYMTMSPPKAPTIRVHGYGREI